MLFFIKFPQALTIYIKKIIDIHEINEGKPLKFQSLKMRYYLLTIISFIFIIFFFGITINAEQNPPPVGGGDSIGDWIIENTDDITRSDQEIRLKGNLTIEDGGKLTFKNVTLKMNCLEDGEFYIDVQAYGELYIYDNDFNNETMYDASIITAVNHDYEYKFNVQEDAKMEMKFSELHECGYSPGPTRKGLVIKSSDVVIDHNLISNNYYGISCYYWQPIDSFPKITNNTIVNNEESGIKCEHRDAIIIGNNISNNGRGGISLLYSSAIIDKNVISNNSYIGIYCLISNPSISNTIVSETEYGIGIVNSNPIIGNMIISDNDNGTIIDSTTLNLTNSTIKNSKNFDFYFEDDSHLKIINTTFDKYKIYFDDYKSNLTVQWYLDVEANDQNTNPIYNAEVRVKDNLNGTLDEIFYTDINGFIKLIPCTEYKQNKTGRIYYTPHDIIVSNKEDTKGDTERMDKSKFLEYVLLDTSPPEIFNVESKIDKTAVIITWETNELSNSVVKYGLSESYGNESYNDVKFLNHIIELNDLELGKIYHFCVNSTDGCGNSNQSDDFTFLIPDIILPQIFNIEYMQITKNSVKIIWTTDEPSNSLVKYGKTESYDLEEYSENLVTSHSIDLTGLEKNTTYHFCVNSIDEVGNSNQSKDFTFTTNDTGDTEPPENPTFSPANGEKVNNKKPIITITFSEEVTITIAKLNGIDIKDDLVSSDYSIYTYTPPENLSEEKNTISVKAKDMIGNKMSEFATSTFIIEISQIDVTPPEISGVEIIEITLNSAIIRWKTNELSTSQIEYGTTNSNRKSTTKDENLLTIHIINITNLKENTTYHFRVISVDENKNENISKDFTFKTLEKAEELNIVVKLEIENLEPKEGDKIKITAKVTNNDKKSVEITIIFYCNNKKIGEKNISIETGKTKNSDITWKAEKGNHTIKVVVFYKGKELKIFSTSKNIVVKEISEKDDSGFNMILLIPLILISIVVGIGYFMKNRWRDEQKIQTSSQQTPGQQISVPPPQFQQIPPHIQQPQSQEFQQIPQSA